MKKVIFILIAGAFLITSCITTPHKIQETKVENNNLTYSYEGMVDPYVIAETWENLSMAQYGFGYYKDELGQLTEIFYKNPNEGNIRIASLVYFVTRKVVIVAYSYLYDEEPYFFILDDKNCYKHDTLTEEEKKRFKQQLLDALNGAST